MFILDAREVRKDIAKLSKAWRAAPTFVFLPEHSGVSKNWIEEIMRSFPEKFKTGHFVLFTSGSTGKPKLVVGSRKRAEKLTHLIHKFQKNELAKETILVLPLTYSYAFVNQWLWARVFARKIICTHGCSRLDSLKEALLKANEAMICLVGSQIALFVKHLGLHVAFPGIARVNFAGGPFPQNDIDNVHRLFPNAEVFNNYGCTEAMPRLCIRPEENSDDGNNVGKPLPGIRLKTDRNSKIFFNSPYSGVCFYDKNTFSSPAESAWISSGDIGKKLENGSWCIIGRADAVFKRYGEKIAIPQLLETICPVWSGDLAFYRERDANGEETYSLVLCPQPTENQYRAILKVFRNSYPRTHWPIRIESTDSLPLLNSGKIDKAALQKKRNKALHWYQRS